MILTTYEKLDVIAKFVADRDYSGNYSSYAGMILSGKGDCWASRDALIYMAQKIGLKAWSRDADKDLGASSGHKNVMTFDGNEYYEVDAGYVGDAPRYYSITKRSSVFSYQDLDNGEIKINQYDEENVPATFVIPSEIDNKKVIAIDSGFVYQYPIKNNRDELKNVILPDTLKEIGDYAFDECNNLKSITIPQSVETIGEMAFGYTFDYSVFEVKKIDGFTIYGYKDSAAEEYANENGFNFVELDNEILIGDVNGDGVVSVSDATSLQKHLANGKIFDEALLKIADTNGDGEVTVADATLIQKYLANSVSSLG